MKKEILATAKLRNINISPTKIRLVANFIRGKRIDNVIGFLENTRRASNVHLLRLIKSAISNAQNKKNNVNFDKIILREIKVDKGFVLKRLRPRAMGRGSLIKKRSSHINISLSY